MPDQTPSATWTPPVYVEGADFDCAAAACVPLTAAWGTAVEQLQGRANAFAKALGLPDRVEVTGGLDTPTLALVQQLARVITIDWKNPTPILNRVLSAYGPRDVAPVVTHLAVDFNQGAARAKVLAVVADRRAERRWRLPHMLIAGGSTLAVIGSTIALVSAARRKPRRRS